MTPLCVRIVDSPVRSRPRLVPLSYVTERGSQRKSKGAVENRSLPSFVDKKKNAKYPGDRRRGGWRVCRGRSTERVSFLALGAIGEFGRVNKRELHAWQINIPEAAQIESALRGSGTHRERLADGQREGDRERERGGAGERSVDGRGWQAARQLANPGAPSERTADN